MSGVDPTDAAERFVEKWSASDLSERGASQEHFIDLCGLLGPPTPAEAGATGKDYCFEKLVKVTQAASKRSKGKNRFVHVWKHRRSTMEAGAWPRTRMRSLRNRSQLL